MRIGLALLAVLALSSCGILPRGAGLQSEVIGMQNGAGDKDQTAEDVAERNFSVEQVTQDNLATFLGWPSIYGDGLPWIERVDQPNTRMIRAGDKLAITIWDTDPNGLLTPPNTRFVNLPDMQVSPDGSIFLPYIGRQKVSGMAPESARARIEEAYVEVTPAAQVQLQLAEGRQSTVSLVEGVQRPGSYPLVDQDVTLMNVIADSGGVDGSFDNPQVRLVRGSKIYGTSVDRLLDNPRLDTTLVGGDKIYIEEDERYFLSLGAASREQLHTFPKDSLTALEALSLIGGVDADRADVKGVLILRRYPAGAVDADGTGPFHPRTVFTIDLTSADGLFSAGQFLIQPRDLVYVTESPVTTARTLFAIVAAGFGVIDAAQDL